MSKRMSKFLTYWTLLVLVQIYGLVIYQYGQTYGFDDQINPTTIIRRYINHYWSAGFGRVISEQQGYEAGIL